MESLPPVQIKKDFFEDHQQFSEIKASDAHTVETFEDINNSDEEVWILQCPKGFKIQNLENHKLKFPGRVKIDNNEAVAIESTNSRQATFGYANRKHQYAVKTLPIAGKIVIRQHLQGTNAITPEMIEEYPSTGHVEMPESIKLRHPLLGAKFDEYLKIQNHVKEKLQSIYNESSKGTDKTLNAKIKTEATTSKKRRTISKENETSHKKAKLIKTENNKHQDTNLLEVSDDLQWIKQI